MSRLPLSTFLPLDSVEKINRLLGYNSTLKPRERYTVKDCLSNIFSEPLLLHFLNSSLTSNAFPKETDEIQHCLDSLTRQIQEKEKADRAKYKAEEKARIKAKINERRLKHGKSPLMDSQSHPQTKSKKAGKKSIPKINNHAYRCNLCGKVVPPKHRSRHLIVAHKLSGYNTDKYFTDTGKAFQSSSPIQKLSNAYGERYRTSDNEMGCGHQTGFQPFVKIIYTPMGNKR